MNINIKVDEEKNIFGKNGNKTFKVKYRRHNHTKQAHKRKKRRLVNDRSVKDAINRCIEHLN